MISATTALLARSMTETEPESSLETQSSLTVRRQHQPARSRADDDVPHIGDARDVDDMDHVGDFRRRVERRAIGAEGEPLWLGAGRDLADHLAAGDVDHLDGAVILQRHEQRRVVRAEDEEFGAAPGRDRARHRHRRDVDHLNDIIVAAGNEEPRAGAVEMHVTRPLACGDRGYDLQRPRPPTR